MTGLDNVTLYALELFERRVTTVASKQDLSCARRLTERVAFEVGSTLTYSMPSGTRSEEHTSELQSRLHLVCRLLLEKKKKKKPHRSSGTNIKSTKLGY